MIKRREFITLLGGAAAAWPFAASAQQQPKVYRIGALFVGNADVESLRTELREALRKSGYVKAKIFSSSSVLRKRSSIDFLSLPRSWLL